MRSSCTAWRPQPGASAIEDVLCQNCDMVQPSVEGMFMLQDLKRQKILASILSEMLFNLNKCLTP